MPKGTPTMILLAETGILSVELIVNKKRIMQAQRPNKHEEKLVMKITMNEDSI